MKLDILYEDQDLLAINKPSNLVVNRAASVKEDTVQDWFLDKYGTDYFTDAAWQQQTDYQKLIPTDFSEQYGKPLELWHERLGIAHRLDKDTSGVLLLAKNPGALLSLLAQFKTRQTHKHYLALVHGHLSVNSGQIVAPIARSNFNRLKFTVKNEEGREAVTQYLVKQEFANLNEELLIFLAKQTHTKLKRVKELYQAGFSLVDVTPKTGRTHQIRVHLAAIQHPVVGDQLYAGRKHAKMDKFWCQRQFLHAASLEFIHPRSGEQIKIEAPLTEDLATILTLVLKN